ncbi:O-antigen ligase family protein [Vibrio sp. ZSDZ34]|uniref:O-antigen ligase family protein n=1 Tax=Vibrio gelatinilyticus TaxID=2893468 RepID=A0A9X2AWC8_9VIBR|nr:O-antigen ligase family protein [Vibrio gelatinilyticus]MCJ2377126.1 O-antigen ligase family protein [Vibrio gelatinilyticus]
MKLKRIFFALPSCYNENREFFSRFLILGTILVLFCGGIGPFITAFKIAIFELLFTILVLYTLLNVKSNNLPIRKGLYPKKNFIIIIMLCIFISLSLNIDLLGSSEPSKMAYISIILLLISCLYLYSLIEISIKYNIELSIALKITPLVISILGLLVFLVGIFDYPKSLLQYSLTGGVPFGSNRRYLGYICTIGTSICLYYLMMRYNISKAFVIVYSSIFTINLSLTIWLGGRAALISIFATLFIFCIYLINIKKFRPHNLTQLITLSFIASFIAYYFSIFEWNGPGRFILHLQENNIENKFNLDKSVRAEIWLQTYNAIIEKPLFGHGPEGYSYHPDHIFGLQPHNSILQILMSYGLISSSIILFLYIQYTTSGIASILNTHNENSILALLVIISLTIHSLVDGTFYHAQPIYFLVISYSIIIVERYKSLNRPLIDI